MSAPSREAREEGRREDRAHPDQDRAGGAARKNPTGSACGWATASASRRSSDPARAEAAYRLRGSVVPQHRRVLRQGHGDLHDPGRPLHAPLPVLRRRARQAAAARCRRAACTSPQTIAALQAQVRRHHERRPRRPARRRRAAFQATASAPCASARRTRASKCWCPISAAGSTSRSTCSRECPPDVMNHNLETVPRLYRQARPGADYAHSLKLLKDFKARFPAHPDQVGADGRASAKPTRRSSRSCATCARTTSTC